MSIIDGPFFLESEFNGVFTEEVLKDWSNEETKEASYDLKSRNILIFVLSTKVYYSISNIKTPQSKWNALQVLYKGTKYIKEPKINI